MTRQLTLPMYLRQDLRLLSGAHYLDALCFKAQKCMQYGPWLSLMQHLSMKLPLSSNPLFDLQAPALVIAQIVSLEKLPKSDKLKKCKVSTGDSSVQVWPRGAAGMISKLLLEADGRRLLVVGMQQTLHIGCWSAEQALMVCRWSQMRPMLRLACM